MTIAVLYDLIFVLPLSVAISAFSKPYMADDVSLAACMAVTVAAAVYIVMLKHMKMRGRMLLAGIGVTFVMAVVFYHKKGERLEFFEDNIWAAKLIAFVLLCVAAETFSKRYPRIRAVIFVCALAAMPLMLILKAAPGKIPVVAIWAYVIFAAADFLQRRSVKDGDRDPVRHLVFVSPFVVAVIILAAVIRSPEAPYDWGFARNITKAVKSECAIIADRLSGITWESDSPIIGFSDRGRIGGNITSFGYDVLDVKSSAPIGDHLYLAGRIYDDFDGKIWSGPHDAYDGDNTFSTLETVGAVIAANEKEALSDSVKDANITVECKNLGRQVYFVPQNCYGIKTETSKRYSASFFILNEYSPAYEKITGEYEGVTEEGWSEAKELCGIDEKTDPFYDLYSYRQEQYDRYLKKTVMSGRLQEYMDEVLADCETDWDKLSIISQMLGSYTYTDSPGTLPDKITDPAGFLDWFVFEKREGYCSYFATAFVLLSRAYGIPARYVQGYRADVENPLHVTIRSTDAHAWPEAYIDGIGWMRFEPTPGFSEISGWHTGRGKTGTVVNIPTPVVTEDDIKIQNGDDEGTIAVNRRRIVIPILAGALFTALMLAVDALFKKRHYDKLDDRNKALWICRRDLALLKRKGFGKRDGETLAEYKIRLSADVLPQLLGFIDIYETLLYSDREISEQERIKLESDSQALKASYRRSFFKTRFEHIG